MADIYELHDKAFARVSAYVVWVRSGDGPKIVAKVAFKRPADGAGRLYAYVHWIGAPMVRGFAAGGGYDKKTAAVASAVARMKPAHGTAQAVFCAVLAKDTGPTWDRQLYSAGFDVVQAV